MPIERWSELTRELRSDVRVVDLFSGAGGFSEGFRQAGFRIAVGSDIDPDACATYRLNFPEAHTVWGDIREPRVRDELLSAASGAEVVVGGPPLKRSRKSGTMCASTTHGTPSIANSSEWLTRFALWHL